MHSCDFPFSLLDILPWILVLETDHAAFPPVTLILSSISQSLEPTIVLIFWAPNRMSEASTSDKIKSDFLIPPNQFVAELLLSFLSSVCEMSTKR